MSKCVIVVFSETWDIQQIGAGTCEEAADEGSRPDHVDCDHLSHLD